MVKVGKTAACEKNKSSYCLDEIFLEKSKDTDPTIETRLNKVKPSSHLLVSVEKPNDVASVDSSELHKTLKQSPSQDRFCDECNNLGPTLLKTTFQSAAYAWAFIFLISGGILWSWVPFVLDDLQQTSCLCLQCNKKLTVCKPKIRRSTEKLFCFLLVIDILILTIIIFYTLII